MNRPGQEAAAERGERQEAGAVVGAPGQHLRERVAGADVDVCFSGRISVSELRLL